VAGAGSGPAEVESQLIKKCVEEHRYSLVLQAQGVGLFAQRYRVDQPRTQTEGQGNSGDGLHRKQAQVDLGRWRGAAGQHRCRPPQRGAFPKHRARGRQGKGGGLLFSCLNDFFLPNGSKPKVVESEWASA
jgi:hypothetical protein